MLARAFGRHVLARACRGCLPSRTCGELALAGACRLYVLAKAFGGCALAVHLRQPKKFCQFEGLLEQCAPVDCLSLSCRLHQVF